MDWSSFIGALIGSVIGFVILLLAIIGWDEFTRRKQRKADELKPPSFDNILESHLEQHIVQNFDKLFPEWSIYALNLDAGASNKNKRSVGIRYRTEAGEIDILCLDSDNNFVVIELKRNKAPDKVVAQTDRYIAWVKENLVQPNQQVRGLIIAKSLDNHLAYTLSQRQNIAFWAYSWHLRFDKNIVQSELVKSTAADVNSEDTTNTK